MNTVKPGATAGKFTVVYGTKPGILKIKDSQLRLLSTENVFYENLILQSFIRCKFQLMICYLSRYLLTLDNCVSMILWAHLPLILQNKNVMTVFKKVDQLILNVGSDL